MEENPFVIIKTLNNMPRFLFWEMDEFTLMIVPAFLGIFLGSFLLMVSGLAINPFYKKIKKKYSRGTFKHKLYWILPTKAFRKAGVLKNIPESYYREFNA